MSDTSGTVITAAILVIGDEILSGRTKDKNIGYIAEYLTNIGVDLREVRVVPDIEEEIVTALNALRHRYTYVFTTGGIGPTHDDITADCVAKAFGVSIDVDEPASLGADRAVNTIAAHALHAGDLIVIDFGTATTLDFSDYGGAYKGGIIAPGINLSLDALVAAAAKLPRIAIEAPAVNSVIGRNTVDQMNIGIYWGYIAMIEGLVARMKAEVGRPVKVIATGGLATLFERHTSVFDAIEPDLTIQGLAIMWQRAHIH